MTKIRLWIKYTRNISLPQSLLPALLAVSCAAVADHSTTSLFASHDFSYDFSWELALLAVIGVAAAHLGMNLADDYFDYKNQVVEKTPVLDDDSIRHRMGKCHYITSGSATLRDLRNAIIVFLAIAVACGLIIFICRGWTILILMTLGAILGLSYSGGPLKLSFRGYGELVIGLLFGPLLMIGVQFAACSVIDWNIILISTCVGLLVTNILYTHSVIDADNDEKLQKMSFARLLRSNKAQLIATIIFTITPFVIITLGTALGWWHWSYIFAIVTLPLALYIIRSIKRFLSGDHSVNSQLLCHCGTRSHYLTMSFCLVIIIANIIERFTI